LDHIVIGNMQYKSILSWSLERNDL
jgi:hypothetical protein